MKRWEWFKVYTRIIWDGDIRELTATQRWIFITLLALAADNGEDIEVVHEGRTRAARKLHASDTKPARIALASHTDARQVPHVITKMLQLCLITTNDSGDIIIPNWYKYQSDTEARRKRAERQEGGEKPEKKRRIAAAEVEVEVYKEETYKEDKDVDAGPRETEPELYLYWKAKPHLYKYGQPKLPSIKAATTFRLERNSEDEIRAVMDWYNDALIDAKTYWGGLTRKGKPHRLTYHEFMEGKMRDFSYWFDKVASEMPFERKRGEEFI